MRRRSPTSRKSPWALAALFAGASLALPRPAFPASGVQETSRCPEPIPLETLAGPFQWRAEPGLEPVARGLAARRDLLASLPGIGAPEAALRAVGARAAPGSRNAAGEPLRPGGGATGADPARPVDRPTVWLLEDLACLEAHGLTGAQPDWVAGMASASRGFIVLRADRGRGDVGRLPATFRHELAHLALSWASGGRAPRWLQEGYAQYATGSWDWGEAWRLRFLLLVRGGGVLDELSLGFPADADRARLAYLLSYTAVHELAAAGGEEGLAALFGALRDGEDVDGALRRTFGLTLGQFEARWRERVKTRYGWLYVLSRASVFWVAVTLLLLWIGRRRRRHDRRRMEALREAERREAEYGEERGPWEDGGWTPGRPPGGLP